MSLHAYLDAWCQEVRRAFKLPLLIVSEVKAVAFPTVFHALATVLDTL